LSDKEAISRLFHDANGSLQGIVTFLEFLEEESLPDTLRADLAAALEQSDRLVLQLRELRSLVKQELGG